MKIFDLTVNGPDPAECLSGFGFVPAARPSANIINPVTPGYKAPRISKGINRVHHTLNMGV